MRNSVDGLRVPSTLALSAASRMIRAEGSLKGDERQGPSLERSYPKWVGDATRWEERERRDWE